MMRRVCVLAVLAMGVAIAGSAEVITFQDGVSPTPDYAGTADAHIISWDGSANQVGRNPDGTSDDQGKGGGNPQNTGAHCYIEEGDYGANGGQLDSKIILIRFDISSIPPARANDVGSAKIGLFYRYERNTSGADGCGGGNSAPGSDRAVMRGRSNAHYLQVQRVLKPWIEGTGGGHAAGGVDGEDTADGVAVTWNHTGIELWEAIGAEGPTDVSPPISSTWFKPTPFTWVWFDVTPLARDWIGNPDGNYGVKISQETDNDPTTQADLPADTWDPTLGALYVGGAYNFVSSDNDIDPIETRPKLVIELLESSSAGDDWTLYR